MENGKEHTPEIKELIALIHTKTKALLKMQKSGDWQWPNQPEEYTELSIELTELEEELFRLRVEGGYIEYDVVSSHIVFNQ